MTRRALTLFLAIACSSTSFLAQAQQLSADEKELATYRLTLANVKKTGAVLKAFAEIEAADPRNRANKAIEEESDRIAAEMQAIEDKEELTAADKARLEKLNARIDAITQEALAAAEAEDKASENKKQPETLAEWEALIKQEPRLLAVLNREGLSAREFAKTTLALMQASLVVGFSQGKVDFAKLPPGVNAENVKFVMENKEALQALEREQERRP